MQLMFATPLAWVVMFAPIAMAIYMGAKIHSLSIQGAQFCLGIFSALMGLSLSTIFLVYTGESIARVFFITASIFGAMSLYGYTTKKDLTSIGSFMLMGLIGILIASLVNIFLASSMIHFTVSVLGVVIFTGLTAYDVQRVKENYNFMGGNQEIAEKASIFGALTLYMDFINLFVMLLRLFGNRRD
jgi:FtsH-binding integral membrane protein